MNPRDLYLAAGYMPMVDCSFDWLTEQEAEDMAAGGIKVFMQCLWTGVQRPACAEQNLRVAIGAGLIPAGYASITASQPGMWHMQQARQGISNDLWPMLRRVPVDVELQGITMLQIEGALWQMQQFNKPRDIYCNYNTWHNWLGNPPFPADCSLLNAYWDEDPDVDFPNLPFGGLGPERCWGEQWSGGSYVDGQFADRSTVRADAFIEPAPPLPDAGEFAMSMASAAHFRRMGWRLADLNDADKENLRWATRQL